MHTRTSAPADDANGKRSPAPSSAASVERRAKRQRKDPKLPSGTPGASTRGADEEARPAASAGPAIGTATPETVIGAFLKAAGCDPRSALEDDSTCPPLHRPVQTPSKRPPRPTTRAWAPSACQSSCVRRVDTGNAAALPGLEYEEPERGEPSSAVRPASSGGPPTTTPKQWGLLVSCSCKARVNPRIAGL